MAYSPYSTDLAMVVPPESSGFVRSSGLEEGQQGYLREYCKTNGTEDYSNETLALS